MDILFFFIGLVGGFRGLCEIMFFVDCVEIKVSVCVIWVGYFDFEIMLMVSEDEVKENVVWVRVVDGFIFIGIFILVVIGDDGMVSGLKVGLGDGYLSWFMGEVE